jgi:hypothetical protein
MPALFLEAVQHVHGIAELDRVDGPVSVTVVIVDDLQHSRAAEAPQHPRVRWMIAELCVEQGSPDDVLDGNCLRSFQLEPIQ